MHDFDLASKYSALAWFPHLLCKCILGVVGIGCGVGMIAYGVFCLIPTLWFAAMNNYSKKLKNQ